MAVENTSYLYEQGAPVSPSGGPAVEIEIVPDAPAAGDTIVDIDEDIENAGDAPVDAAVLAVMPHTANWAEAMTATGRSALASDLIRDVDQDEMDRSDWYDTVVKGIKLLGFKFDQVSEPWDGASAVFDPLLAQAAVAFQARTAKQLFPASGPAKSKVRGVATAVKLATGARVAAFLNDLLTGHVDYRNELEKALFNCGLTGSGFIKVFWSASAGRPLARSVPPENVVLSPDATSIATAMRVTHVQRWTLNEIKQFQSDKTYRECVVQESPAGAENEATTQKGEISGIEMTNDTRPTLYETQMFLRLSNYDKALESLDPTDGTALPYVVTVDRYSHEVLAIRRNWEESDQKSRPLQHFVHYMYIVSDISPYGLGLVHLIGQASLAATGIDRSTLDAAALANLGGGFKARGLRSREDNTPMRPGEWRDLDVPAGALRDNLVPHAFKEPSASLITLRDKLVEAAQQLASVPAAGMDDLPHNAAAFAVLALLEREIEPQASVHIRLHAALGYQLQLIASIVREEMAKDGGPETPQEMDFAQTDIVPVSNPNESTAGTKMLKLQTVIDMMTKFPDEFDKSQVISYGMALMGEPEFEPMLAKKNPPPQLDPVSENMRLLTGQPIKAFLEQDHDAHLMVHTSAMKDPKMQQTLQTNPNAMVIMQAANAHVAEHLAMKYRTDIERELGTSLPPPGQPLPPDVEARVASLTAQAADRLLKRNEAIAAQDQLKDPVVQAQLQDTANETRRVEVDAEDKRGRRQIEAVKVMNELLKNQSTMELGVLNILKDIAGGVDGSMQKDADRVLNATLKDADRSSREKQTEAQRAAKDAAGAKPKKGEK